MTLAVEKKLPKPTQQQLAHTRLRHRNSTLNRLRHRR